MKIKIFVSLFFLFFSYIQADNLEDKDKNYWVNLLKKKEFSKLEMELQILHNKYLKDVTKEKNIAYALDSFNNSDPKLEALLKQWAEKKKDSGFADTALGVYYSNLAYLSRGSRFIRYTTDKQIQKMRYYSKSAIKNLRTAIEKDPKLTRAFAYLLQNFRINGKDEKVLKVLKKALEHNPYSYTIRYNHLVALLPKWGGSFDQLQAFMDDTKQYYPQNSNLKIQAGYMFYAKADALKIKENPDKEKMMKYINKAIEINPNNPDYIELRGDINLYKLNNYENAVADFTKALEISPDDLGSLDARATANYYLKNYELALKDSTKSIQYDKLNPRYLRMRGKIYYKLNKKELALKDFTDSLIYDNSNASTYSYMGYIYYSQKNYALSSELLLKADALKEGGTPDWYRIVTAQWHDKNCDFIDSAKIYMEKCKKENNCSQSHLNWVTGAAKHAKTVGMCSKNNHI